MITTLTACQHCGHPTDGAEYCSTVCQVLVQRFQHPATGRCWSCAPYLGDVKSLDEVTL